MKVFNKGQVVIPVALRKKYGIKIGKEIEFVETAEGILLKAAPKERADESLTEKLFGRFARFAQGKTVLKKSDITSATEKEFIKEWKNDTIN